MSNRDMELALRIRADLAQARTALQGLGTDLQQVGDTAAATGTALDKIDTGGLDKAGAMAGATVTALESVGQAATGAAAGLQAEGESAAQAEQRIKAMVQASLEYQRAMQAQIATDQALSDASRGTAEANAERVAQAQKVNQAALESQKAITSEIRAIGELSDRIERGASSLKDLADTEQMMDRAMRAGLLSVEEQAKMFQELDKQERQLLATREREQKQMQGLLRVYDPASAALAKLAADEARLKAAVDAGRISREQYNRAMVGITTQRVQWEQARDGVDRVTKRMDSLNLSAKNVRNSLASVATQLAQGNVAGAGSSLLSLGTRGAASFGVMGGAIGGVVATLALFATAAWRGYQESQALERALVTTGRSSGATASSIQTMAGNIDQATQAIGKGREALLLLQGSGQATADVLEDAGKAAVALSELTGQSIQETTRLVASLMQEPAKYSAELNKQYNFLTSEIHEQILALERQGNTTDAVKLATQTFATSTSQRLAEVTANLGMLESAWHYVKIGAAAAWDEMKGIGRAETNVDRASEAQQQMASLMAQRQKLMSQPGLTHIDEANIKRLEGQILVAQDRYIAAQRDMMSERDKADKQALDRQKENAAIAAQSRAENWRAQNREVAKAQERKQLEQDIAAARAAGRTELGGMNLAQYERKRIADLDEKYKAPRKPRTPKTDGQRADESAQRELDNLQKQIALLDDLEDGETKASEAARIRYEVEQGAYRNASDALKQQLLDQAPLLDEGRKRIEVAKQLVNVEMEIARLQGKGSDAAIAKTRGELEKLKADLERFGEDAKAADVAKLLNLIQARQDLDGFQAAYNQAMGAIAMEQQRIQVELQAGLMTEAQAQRAIVGVYQNKLGTLRELVPQMRAAAEALGDPAALANVEQIELKLREMSSTTDLLQQSIKNTFEGAFANLLTDLVMQTESLSDAVRNFFMSMAQGLAQYAAAQLAQAAAMKLMSMFNKGGGGNADLTEGAAALGKSALVAGLAGGAIKMGANQLGDSAKELAAAAAMLMVANTMGSATGFADGGFTGPGHKYQLAGYVHAGEFVHRQEVVRQPGALAFLRAFNMRGMAVLDGMRGYANGGLVAPAQIMAAPAPSINVAAPSPVTAPAAQLNMRLINQLDPGLFDDYLDDPSSDQVFVNKISRNAAKIRSVVGG